MSNSFFKTKYQRRFTLTLRQFTFCLSETFKTDIKNTEIIKKKTIQEINYNMESAFNKSSPLYKTMYQT